MLASVHVVAKAIFDNLAFDGISAVALALLGFEAKSAPLRFKEWRARRRLMKGDEAVPGFSAVKPLGDRLVTVELRQKDMASDIKHINGVLDVHTHDLRYIVLQLSNNGGESTKDQISQIKDAVVTANGQTVGELLDANEGRRVDALPSDQERTKSEQGYIDRLQGKGKT